MARFTSNKFPSLLVKFSTRDRVKFERGSAEVSGDLAERLAAFAENHPDYEIEQVEADPKPQTPKQKAVAKAESLGLSTDGTQAEIEARIAEHEAAQSDEDPEDGPEDDADGDESDEQDDEDESDDDSSDDA